jgi:YesN/AraC family two-component response regulator
LCSIFKKKERGENRTRKEAVKAMLDWLTRIMLVDNNSVFINNLEEALKKISKPYAFVYKGSDASDALMSFSALQPDLIIADIRMPGIDGIATTQIIKEENPSCVCILLSADERACKFSLMQRVVRAHCDDFMEASMTGDDIAAVLLNCEALIQKRKEFQLSALLCGDYEVKASLVAQMLPFRCAPVLLCTNALSPDQLKKICERINQIFPMLHLFVPAMKRPSTYTVLLKCVSKIDHSLRSSEERQADILIVNLAASMLGYVPYLLTLEPVSPTQLNEAYRAMEESVSYSVSIENGKPFRITLPFRIPDKDYALSQNELRTYVESEQFADLFRMMGESGLSRKEIVYQFSVCVSMLKKNGYFRDDADHLEFCEELYRRIIMAERIDETARAIDALFVSNKRLLLPAGDDRLLLTEIIAYLHSHIQNNLSHDDIAEAFSVSKSKLSKLVRRELNDSVKHYYMALKMEEAKKQLLAQMKVGAVAARLGFTDPLYFSRVFKQYIGESPNTFRERAVDSAGQTDKME